MWRPVETNRSPFDFLARTQHVDVHLKPLDPGGMTEQLVGELAMGLCAAGRVLVAMSPWGGKGPGMGW